MAKNIVDRKYYALIWASLIVASLVANVYGIYLSFIEMESITRASAILAVLRAIFIDGAIPAVVCYFLAMIVYSIGLRRYVGAIPRNDFVYTVMAFTAAVRLVCGIVEAFCILVPRMYVITSAILSPLLLTVAYGVMFFFVFARRYNLNPVEKYNSFRLWATVYLVVLGLGMVLQNALYLIVFDDEEFLALVNSALADVAGYILVRDELQIVASALALSLYAVFVTIAVVLGEIMRKQAKGFQDPNTRGDYFDAHPNNPYSMRDDVRDTYVGFEEPNDARQGDSQNGNDNDKNSGDGNVFDEFDI
ncbi:MAG: hypothetical protein IK048_03955 [Clostridia bacterium]|nr:hypothetical protein [Clostridia bacterium]